MELAEILRRRRAVRNYTGEPVERAALERIAAAARHAPSAGYSQGQRVLVVTEPATRAALADALDEPERLARGLEPWLSVAPAHLLVLVREQDYHDRYRREDKLVDGREIEWPVPFWHVDAGAAMMLLLLAAIDEGLAAGVYGVPVEAAPAVRELLAIPEELAIVAGVTVGRAAPDPRWSEATSRRTQHRRPLADRIRWERWDG